MTPMWKVCPDCRTVDEDVERACRECGSERHVGEAYLHRTLAEAAAVGMWLGDGYCLQDIKDSYFRPRR